MIARLVVIVALAACGGGQRPVDPEGTGNTAPATPLAPGKLEDLRGDVVAIEIEGLKYDEIREARRALTSAVGKPFELDRVTADLRSLYRRNGIADVHVEGRLVDGGVGLRFTVTVQPRINAIEVRGATALAADHLIEHMRIHRGDALDPVSVAQARVAMLDEYHQVGYANAAVTWEARPRESGHDVVFNVVEGPAVVVQKIDVRGNRAVATAEMLALIGKDGGPSVGGRYWAAGLERGLLNITARYYDLGYINVVVRSPATTTGADGAVTIGLVIEEGDQFKLAAPTFEGTLIGTPRDYLKLLGVKAGDVFNRSKLNAGLERIRELHRSKGNASASIEPETEIDAAKKRIKLKIVIK